MSKKKFMFDTALVTASSTIGKIITYFVIILVSKYLGAEGLGQYSFIYSFVGFFFLFTDWGVTQLMVKELSKSFKDAQRYINNVFTFKVATTLVSFLAYILIIPFIDKKEILLPLFFGGIWMVLHMFTTIPYSILRIKQASKRISISIIIERTIVLIGAFIILPKTQSLSLFLLILVLSKIAEAIIIYSKALQYISFSFTFDKKFIIKLIKQGYPFMLVVAFITIFVQMDTIMLSFIKSDLITGWYNAPYKLVNILNMFPTMFVLFGFTHLSKLFSTKIKEFKRLLEKMLEYSLIIMIPCIAGVWLIGDRILNFIYQFNSIESVISFKILIIVELFVILTGLMGTAIAADKQKKFAQISGIGAIINIILNFLLIPKWSLYGAGIATLVTYIIMFILMYKYIFFKMTPFKLWRNTIIPLLSTAGMAFMIIKFQHMHMIILILISITTYFTIIYLLHIIKNTTHKNV